MNIIVKYASLVRFPHTVFAMPFAMVSYVAAMSAWPDVEPFTLPERAPFSWWLLLKIVLCMVLARNAAMSFNRIADRDIDARNPRTREREIPSGKLSVRAAGWFCAVNCLLFVAAAASVNRLALCLSPVALLVLLGYSYTKRITSWSHLVLGFALAIAPIGAWIAVRGGVAIFPLVMAGVVLTWVGGFDIIYSLQDREFDKREGLRSVPARFSVCGSLAISIALHVVSALGVTLLGRMWLHGTLYTVGATIFVAMLVVQHVMVTPRRLESIPAAFATVNGVASMVYSLLAILSLTT
ncbi:MAG: putative 4-hydroxybenzoate polyprenyltransferase [Rikenellaceae bacterium]|jgi:4-hydroxybenzoate polyprenyltransferase|nr:putative 4-hydroxybenzoate polyprenyltransferase [Rikenellaceae bacterium]